MFLLNFLIISIGCILVCLEGVTGRYKCMSKGFIRLGNSCYMFSSEIQTWQEAHFRCRDHDSQLAVLATQYEDTTVRSYLERSEFAQLGRWIGGMWVQGRWVWAAQGTEIENQASFSSPSVLEVGENEQWICLYMDPRNRYRWSSDNCLRKQHYICEAPLTKSVDVSSNSTTNNTDTVTTGSPATELPTSTTEGLTEPEDNN